MHLIYDASVQKNQIAFFDNLTTNFTDDHDDTMDSNKLGEKVTAIPNNFQGNFCSKS